MSSLTEALSAGLASGLTESMNPMNGIMRQLANQHVETQALAYEESKSDFIEKVELKLNAAINRKAPASVIAAYEKQLAKVTS